MPIRDFVLSVFIFGMLPVCVARPWIGLLMWSWIGYMNPHRLTWSFAFWMPWAELVAIATLVGIVFQHDPERGPIPWYRETRLLLALWIVYTVTTVFALYPEAAWRYWARVSKILLFTFLPLMYFQHRQRLRWLFLVLALSLGFYGIKGAVFSLRGGGANNVMGPEGSFIGGNTEIGLALNMTLPFLLVLAREEPRPWLRRLLLAMFVGSIVSIIFTYSRGAMLGLPVVLVLLFARARHRAAGVIALGILAAFLLYFAPPQWFDRMHTIQSYESDLSARMRLQSWTVAWRLALDRPLTGGGFLALPHGEIYLNYFGPTYLRAQSAHSIYFTVLGDHGFPGLILFVGLILSSLLSLTRLRRQVAGDANAAWIARYAEMIQTSLVAYAISGAFLTEAYWDLFYALVSFVVLLKATARKPAWSAAPAPAVAPRPVPVLTV